MWKIVIFCALIFCACTTDENTVENEEEPSIEIQTTDGHNNDGNSGNSSIDNHQNDSTEIKSVVKATSTHSYRVVFVEETGWGYQIFNGATKVIDQMHIPAIQGIRGFSTQRKAEKTAEYVLNQVEKGNFPPTLSTEILDSLDVL